MFSASLNKTFPSFFLFLTLFVLKYIFVTGKSNTKFKTHERRMHERNGTGRRRGEKKIKGIIVVTFTHVEKDLVLHSIRLV